MWGSDLFRQVNGNWDHVGTVTAALPAGFTYPIGTHLQYKPVDASSDDESQAVLASGLAVGFMTQPMDDNGLEGDASFKKMALGLKNLPLKNGSEVSLRRPGLHAEMEFEGSGTALPGNLVCTSGTGAIATSTALKTELSVLNGCLRQAQSGDFVMYILENAKVTPEADAANVRIRVRAVGPYKKA